jgi:hypothetical protein
MGAAPISVTAENAGAEASRLVWRLKNAHRVTEGDLKKQELRS